MSMTKEEIALQLALSAIQYIPRSTHSSGMNFNESFSTDIANMYNTIYNKIDCYKPSNNDFTD